MPRSKLRQLIIREQEQLVSSPLSEFSKRLIDMYRDIDLSPGQRKRLAGLLESRGVIAFREWAIRCGYDVDALSTDDIIKLYNPSLSAEESERFDEQIYRRYGNPYSGAIQSSIGDWATVRDDPPSLLARQETLTERQQERLADMFVGKVILIIREIALLSGWNLDAVSNENVMNLLASHDIFRLGPGLFDDATFLKSVRFFIKERGAPCEGFSTGE